MVVQEYIPEEQSEDWIFNGYFDADSTCVVGFTGVKYRSWPPHFGVATYARAVSNAPLVAEAAAFCRRVGYRGVVDMDWRLDRRDGRYHLLDCNPRVGSSFRLFQSVDGIDVVHALHLDLTGRNVPRGTQTEGRGFLVEHSDPAALLSYRRLRPPAHAVAHERGPIERAWWAWDDPVPAFVMAARGVESLARLPDHLRAVQTRVGAGG